MSLFKQLAMVALLLGAGAAFYAFGWPLVVSADSPQPAAKARGGNRTAVVVVRSVELKSERTRLKAVGTARALRSVTLYAAAAGEVAAVRIAPNARVEKGEVLLELDSRSEALAVELARVRVKSAGQLLSRYERMSKGAAVSRSALLDARNALEEVTIALRQAEVALSDRKVVASFDGFVGVTEIDVGDRIGTGDAITTLDDRRTLLVAFDIPELFLGLIPIGHPVQVATWGEQERPIEGAIVDLGSRIDPASRSFVARARVINDGDRYRPGMSFAVTLDVQGKRYPLVPEIAVRYGAQGAFVWVVRAGKATRVDVRVVQRQDATVLIDAAIEAGELIVVEGIQRLRPGLDVTLAASGGSS